ncbi:TetR/AcrR family transcriptional regulator [Streptomyces varsoviensis]|uniref:TetR/AcrR family transcriptional regulator n=1 Tax=Streptomyces varsoviensis TaxID=67373 RepID=UPI0033D4E00A
MPKIVDPEARRQEVAEAVFRVVGRDGLEHASLRNVADEAGLAIGSVRHYFADHAELMIFAMDELSRRTDRRVRAHADEILDPASRIDRAVGTEELLAELLPLDEARHAEAVLWLAFTSAARTRPELQHRSQEMHDSKRSLMAHVLSEADRLGGLPPGTDIEVESLRLTALLDGLAFQLVLHPGHTTPDAARHVLRRHLRGLQQGN